MLLSWLLMVLPGDGPFKRCRISMMGGEVYFAVFGHSSDFQVAIDKAERPSVDAIRPTMFVLHIAIGHNPMLSTQICLFW